MNVSQVDIDRMNEQMNSFLGPKPIKIQDLKVGDKFQMEGLDTNGDTVQCDATLIAYHGMNKYVIDSDGITILYDGEQEITKKY
tara:strand:- start:3677 stop:3928 length:252 start_codon:yes stop_codon:yes gene_type:complete